MIKKWALIFLVFLGLTCSVVPPKDAIADASFLQVTGNPYNPTGPYLVLPGMNGQSACTVGLTGTTTGTWAVEGILQGSQSWTGPLTVVTLDGSNPSTSITAAGAYAFNCANMIAIRLDGTSGTGTPLTVLSAGGGVNRVLSNGVNGGRTIVAGSSPITVTNAGNTATVACPTCATGTPLPISVQAGSNVTVATPSPGVFVVSAITPSPAPTPLAISVQAGTGVAVATPSPGVFVVSNTGVLSVGATGNLSSSGGQNPVVTITNAPTFTGQVSAASLKASNLTSGDCLQSASGVITSASTSCPNGGLGGITAGNDIVVTPTNPNAPTVSVTNSPTFTGTATVQSNVMVGIPGNLGGNALYLANNLGVGGQQSVLYPTTNVVSGVTGSVFTFYNSGNGFFEGAMNNAGDFGISGSFHSANVTNGNCLQGGASGLIQSLTAACLTTSNSPLTVTNIVGNVSSGTVTQTVTPPATATTYKILAISPGSGGGGGGSGAAAGGGGGGGSGAALPSPLTFNIAQLLASYGSTSIVVSIPPSGGGGTGGNAGNGNPGTSASPITITCNGTQIFTQGPLVAGGGGLGGTTAAGGTGGSFTNISGFNAINGANGSLTSGGVGGTNGLTGVSGGGGGGGVSGTGGTGGPGVEWFFGNATGTPANTNGTSVPVNFYGGGKAGGGGSSGSINGGNGGNYGSGGGGGAATTSGTAGSGGAGGSGFVVVTTS